MSLVDERINAFLVDALERISAIPDPGPAKEAALATLRECRTLRARLEAELDREVHYITEAVEGLLEDGDLTDDDAGALGLGKIVDGELELSDLGRAVVRRLIDGRHRGITFRAVS